MQDLKKRSQTRRRSDYSNLSALVRDPPFPLEGVPSFQVTEGSFACSLIALIKTKQNTVLELPASRRQGRPRVFPPSVFLRFLDSAVPGENQRVSRSAFAIRGPSWMWQLSSFFFSWRSHKPSCLPAPRFSTSAGTLNLRLDRKLGEIEARHTYHGKPSKLWRRTDPRGIKFHLVHRADDRFNEILKSPPVAELFSWILAP